MLDLQQEAAPGGRRRDHAPRAARRSRLGADVSKRDQVQAAVDTLVAEFGGLHILVNNAGVLRDNLLFKMTDDDWTMVMEVHLRGAFLCSQIAQKHMVEAKYGRIVCMSSTSALGNRGQANYSTAKAGLQGLTKTLAIELGPFGVTANAIAPGFIETAMTKATAERIGTTIEQMREATARRAGAPRRRARRHRQHGRVLRRRGGRLRHRPGALRRRRPRPAVTDHVRRTRATYDEVAADYAERHATPWPELNELMTAFLVRLPERARILDAGCGPGRDTRLLRGRGARVVGLDLSFGMLRSQSLSGAVQADMRTLPVADAAVDGVWCHAALLHIPRPDVPGVVGEFARITRAGGVLHLAVSEGDGEGWESEPYAAGNPRWFVRHRLESLRETLADAGWHVVDVSRLHYVRDWLFLLATTSGR